MQRILNLKKKGDVSRSLDLNDIGLREIHSLPEVSDAHGGGRLYHSGWRPF